MCGIVGHVIFDSKVNLEAFNSMRDTLTHRGPDGMGTMLLNNEQVALGHRRLSILDLSEDGAQPMCNEDGSVWITFNGEIYNYPILRKELESLGHRFKSNSDTEALIHGYEQWGIDRLLPQLKGMFSFALWDSNTNMLHAARDRFGIKPFVYYFDGKQFIFASELKAIMKHKEVPRTLDYDSLSDYFTYGYVPYPRTIWKNAHKLPPAHYLSFSFQDFKPRIKKYWHLEIADIMVPDNIAVEKTQKLIRDSVQEHLLSDVPVGLFLSGGYDSTTLLMHMSDLGYKTTGFTIGFPDSEQSEHTQAAAAARHFGADHITEMIGQKMDIISLLQRMSPFYDEPFAISSMINTYVVSELAAKHKKVVFSGEGADEVFAGYKWHRKIDDYYRALSLKQRIKNILEGNYSSSQVFQSLYNRSMTGVLKEASKGNVLNKDIRNKMRKRGLWHFEEFYFPTNNKVKLSQFVDTHTFIPDHCLFRADISSMAHSLEVRVPFLDHEIYEYVFSLNTSVYFKPGVKKFLLEENLKHRMPPEVMSMPKRGFSFQNTDSIFDDRFEEIIKSGELVKHKIINKDFDINGLSEHFKLHLLNLEFWLQDHYNN